MCGNVHLILVVAPSQTLLEMNLYALEEYGKIITTKQIDWIYIDSHVDLKIDVKDYQAQNMCSLSLVMSKII